MIDKSAKVGDCTVFLIDGNIISIDKGDYVNAYNMNLSEWEEIKAAVDRLISEVKVDETNPTATC